MCALQVYACLGYNHFVSAEVMRYIHAANHLFYMEGMVSALYSRDATRHTVQRVVERNLLTWHEALFFVRNPGVNKGYQCTAWALQLITAEVSAGRLPAHLYNALDGTISEFRQRTTLPPMIAKTPVPYPYYHKLHMFLFMFHMLQAMSGSLSLTCGIIAVVELRNPDFTSYDRPIWLAAEVSWSDAVLELGVELVVLIVIVLLVDSLFALTIMLADPWGNGICGLPIKEYITGPLMAHRALFTASTNKHMPAGLGHSRHLPSLSISQRRALEEQSQLNEKGLESIKRVQSLVRSKVAPKISNFLKPLPSEEDWAPELQSRTTVLSLAKQRAHAQVAKHAERFKVTRGHHTHSLTRALTRTHMTRTSHTESKPIGSGPQRV